MDNYTEEILLPDVLGDLSGITRHGQEREVVQEMKVPNWIRVFFLLEPRPPEIPRRVVVCGAGKAPSTRKKPRHVFRTDPDSRPEPVVVRKNVKAGKIRDDKPLVFSDPNDPNPQWSFDILQRDTGKKSLIWRWNWLFVALQLTKEVRIRHDQHLGKLRGVDILIAARRDFKRAGIPVVVKLCGNHGFISLADKN